MQECSRCRAVKGETDFPPSKRGKLGAWCRSCWATRRREIRLVEKAERLGTRTCKRCGQTLSATMSAKAIFCPGACRTLYSQAKMRATSPEWVARKRARDAERHALKHGGAKGDRFTLDDIFERDAARCHLCRKKVRRSVASIDHVVPLSHGGEHSLANVALAHRSCNSSKKNGYVPGGEQLRLVG